ncbi:hypothetical protein JHK82_031052 [Glycine max]|nr:hypothetical protein JHK86_031145 [Glycine max]KAG5124315.1 hypothetical protein JHK82_031052 [Glycine max]KAH1115893.1 hypothetical protein GYH30_057167 [Glycine max]
MWTLYISPPMWMLTVCRSVGLHGVLMSTLVLSNLRSSSTSSSTSTRSPIAATIFRICTISHATNGMPQQ